MKKWYFSRMLNFFQKIYIICMPRKKIQEEKKKIKTGVTINSEVVEMMDEMLDDIGNTNRSRYIEKLIREDLEKRGKNIERDF